MDAVLTTLAELPPGLLYAILAAVAFIENVIPPFPADVTIAFGAFLAARAGHGLAFVFACAWAGHVAGAMAAFAFARKHGTARLERFIGGSHAEERDRRLRALIGRYGVAAMFLARFVPGVRALVPLVAGAARMPWGTSVTMMALAGAIWYGGIIAVTYRLEAWAEARGMMTQLTMTAAVLAGIGIVAGATVWLVMRLRRTRSP